MDKPTKSQNNSWKQLTAMVHTASAADIEWRRARTILGNGLIVMAFGLQTETETEFIKFSCSKSLLWQLSLHILNLAGFLNSFLSSMFSISGLSGLVFSIILLNFHFFLCRMVCENPPARSTAKELLGSSFCTKGTADDIDEPMKKFLDYVDGKPGAEKGDPYIRRLHQDVENVRMNKEWRREYMDFQITIKQKEREAVEKAAPKIREEAIAEATPKIRAEAIAEATPKIIAGEKNRIITRMLEDGSLSDEQIVAITGASAEELENCKRAVRKN